MATVLNESETVVNHEPESKPQPFDTPEPQEAVMDESLLVNRAPEWFRVPRALAGFVLLLGLLLILFSRRPVWHTDVWGHLSYGRLIAESNGVPATEPFMPLAKGTTLVATAWLSQVIGFWIHKGFGVAGLQTLYAAVIIACLGVFCWQCYRRGGSFWMSLVGCGLFLWAERMSIIILRPQLAGLLCFMVLFNLLTSPRWHRANWFAVPLILALWANLHGSFPVGLGLLGAFCLGRAIDVFRRSSAIPLGKRWIAVVRDATTRRFFLLLELAAVAVLLNPYGLGLYAEVLQFSLHPNLARVVEWSPLTLRMDDGALSQQGTAVAVIAVLLMFLYRFTPRRISAVEPLVLIGLGAATLWLSRMIVWWAPVAAYYAALHGGATFRAWRRVDYDRPRSPSTSLWAVVSIGMVWIAFALTPLGGQLIRGEESRPESSLSRQTPIRAAEFLREHPPKGLVFNTAEAGDYLLWDGPDNLNLFATSHFHLIPEEVWNDYLNVIDVYGPWESLLDRYGVNTVVLNTVQNPELAEALRKEAEWDPVFEDDRSIIFVRKSPI